MPSTPARALLQSLVVVAAVVAGAPLTASARAPLRLEVSERARRLDVPDWLAVPPTGPVLVQIDAEAGGTERLCGASPVVSGVCSIPDWSPRHGRYTLRVVDLITGWGLDVPLVLSGDELGVTVRIGARWVTVQIDRSLPDDLRVIRQADGRLLLENAGVSPVRILAGADTWVDGRIESLDQSGTWTFWSLWECEVVIEREIELRPGAAIAILTSRPRAPLPPHSRIAARVQRTSIASGPEISVTETRMGIYDPAAPSAGRGPVPR